MQVGDVMTRKVVSVATNDAVLKAARLMLQNKISGLPVTDAVGKLVGIVIEGDFLRRGEIGTQHRQPKWLVASAEDEAKTPTEATQYIRCGQARRVESIARQKSGDPHSALHTAAHRHERRCFGRRGRHGGLVDVAGTQ